MLFNFQGPPLSFDSLFILAHRFSFVNTFFKTFLSFFSVDFENRFAMRFLEVCRPLFRTALLSA